MALGVPDMIKPEEILTYWLSRRDDGTWGVSIDTSECSYDYRNCDVQFLCNGDMAFPVVIETRDDDGNKINTYSLAHTTNKE